MRWLDLKEVGHLRQTNNNNFYYIYEFILLSLFFLECSHMVPNISSLLMYSVAFSTCLLGLSCSMSDMIDLSCKPTSSC